MGAVAVHHTGTSDGAWDGPANEARLRSGESASYYRRAYAWQDPDGDPTTKTAWRFIHHEVSGEGSPGAANLRACSTGIGVLNGGRGGTTIPSGDRQGVWNHLAAHLRDGDMEPPELRDRGLKSAANGDMESGEMERRYLPAVEGHELRVVDGPDGGPPHVMGYAAVFNAESEGLPFVEVIRPGAFARAIKERQDVRSLWNHDVNYVLGRTAAGTLSLAEDEVGLRIDAVPPDTQWARDLLVSIRRGDVSGMSFGFSVPQGGDVWQQEPGKQAKRAVTDVDLYDAGPVTFPAYPQTVVSVRQHAAALRAEADAAVEHKAQEDLTRARADLQKRLKVRTMWEV